MDGLAFRVLTQREYEGGARAGVSRRTRFKIVSGGNGDSLYVCDPSVSGRRGRLYRLSLPRLGIDAVKNGNGKRLLSRVQERRARGVSGNGDGEDLRDFSSSVLESVRKYYFDAVYNECFEDEGFMKGVVERARRIKPIPWSFGAVSPDATRVWSPEEEKNLFLRYNFCRYSAGRMFSDFVDGRKFGREKFHNLAGSVVEQRNVLIEGNMRLIGKMLRGRGEWHDFEDDFSDGYVSVMRAVNGFDVGRGFKFSTYACWAIEKDHWRRANMRRHDSWRFRTGMRGEDDEDYYSSFIEEEDLREWVSGRGVSAERDWVRDVVDRNVAGLTRIERGVVENCFEFYGPALNYKEMADVLGCSHAAIGFIKDRALGKLRDAFEREGLRC